MAFDEDGRELYDRIIHALEAVERRVIRKNRLPGRIWRSCLDILGVVFYTFFKSRERSHARSRVRCFSQDPPGKLKVSGTFSKEKRSATLTLPPLPGAKPCVKPIIQARLKDLGYCHRTWIPFMLVAQCGKCRRCRGSTPRDDIGTWTKTTLLVAFDVVKRPISQTWDVFNLLDDPGALL